MPRIAGVDIPHDKRIVISLQYIYGIGPHHACEILKEAAIDQSVRANKLTDDELSRIGAIIDRSYVVEGQLRRQMQQNIARLRDITCYRGLRHRRGLPVHGQRTRSNARTRKGPRKTVAGKKGIKEMHR
jgi:small subunit ribosomal protein S13